MQNMQNMNICFRSDREMHRSKSGGGGDGLPPQGSFCETLILMSGCHYEKNAANYAQKAMVSS